MLKIYMVVLVPAISEPVLDWDAAVARVRTYVRAKSNKDAREIAEKAMFQYNLHMKAQYSRCIEDDETGMREFKNFMNQYVAKGE